MYKLKPHKSVEQIAKKHRMNVYDIQKQLDMGEPIEHEHTKNHKLAMDIALQHLDEIPDYYTRLKKMEASAKKEHKKFKDVKEATDGIKAKDYKGRLDKWFDDDGWVQTGGKYDGKPCAKQPGQNTKPYCRDPDDRAAMGKDERNKRAAKKRREDPNPNRSGKAKMVTQESAGEKDACYKKVKSRYDVWPSAYASGALVKCRKVGAANWGNKSESIDLISNDPLSEAIGMIRYCPKCEKNETREECRYGPKFWDMFSRPSSLSPNQMKFSIAQVHPANESTEYNHIEEGHKEIASGKKKDGEGYMARNELDTVMKAVSSLKKNIKKGNQQLPAWVQSKITKATDYIDTAADYIDSDEEVSEAKKCWPGYKKKGTQKLFGKTYNRCVKEGNRTFSQFMDEAAGAWQRKEGKNPEGGLNAKGVASYRRENPGSKLQTAVTTEPSKLEPGSKDAKRRKLYCSRSAGQMKMWPKAAKDPNSRLILARRKWNC